MGSLAFDISVLFLLGSFYLSLCLKCLYIPGEVGVGCERINFDLFRLGSGVRLIFCFSLKWVING